MNIPGDAGLFEALFETAPDATLVVDNDGIIVLANRQADRLFGFTEHELLGLSIELLLPETMRDAHRRYRTEFVAASHSRSMGAGVELVGLRRDGTLFPTEISLSLIVLQERRWYVTSVRDISETQRARRAIARARYDLAVGEAGRLALNARDHESIFHEIPAMAASALSVPAVAILLRASPRHPFEIHSSVGLSDEQRQALQHATHDVPTKETFVVTDLPPNEAEALWTFMHGSGYRDGIIAPLVMRFETIGALLAFTTSDRGFDQDQRHFLQSIGNLLAAAVERTRYEEQISHSQRLDAVGQLTGGIAHDFNNLLTVISGNLQLLEPEETDDERREIIQSALRATQSGGALTRKLLAFARRQRLQPKNLDLNTWLHDLLALLRRTLGETIDVRVACPPVLPSVYADPGELDAAIVNLALNARDAMPKGGCLTIDISETALDAAFPDTELSPGQYIAISVTDTGHGMPPDVLACALEPFFTTKDAGKGNGLGLSMVYGFARQSGGALTIESEPGHGTRVCLYLPAASASGRPDTNGKSSSAKIAPVPVSSAPLRVLVVEDEPEVRRVAIAFLHSLGHDTITAAHADDVLAILRRESHIDVLFSDVILGAGMTGVDLAQQAQRLHPSIVVLLVSGYEDDFLDAEHADLALLRKPYTREELSAALHALRKTQE
jgi:PAS domain S-box-containing protein